MEQLELIDISRRDKKNDHAKTADRRSKTDGKPKCITDGVKDKKRKATAQRGKVRKRKRRKKQSLSRLIAGILMVAVVILFCVLLYFMIRGVAGHGAFADVLNEERRTLIYKNAAEKPMITEDFLTPNENSRPGTKLKEVKNIFVHYTANPGTSAAQNRSYFENLGITKETSASAHFIIGYEGEIIQCLPLDEIGYAVQTRNMDSISIECCYLDEDGRFTDATYNSLIQLCAWLLNEYDLMPEDLMRHYDEAGKLCPLYYAENEAEWQKFVQDVKQYIVESAERT